MPALDVKSLRTLALNNGWTHWVEPHWDWWSEMYTKTLGEKVAYIRVRWVGDRITDMQHADGSGVVLLVKKNKKAELAAILKGQ